jgi:stage V sporulation protein D (sporulation-specific penicillin-binding protein)
MELGEKLGRDKLYKYIDAFGFGRPTGIDVNFEESGVKRGVSKTGPVELANLSFGQGISITPMQMISAFAAIANNGKMMEPHLVKRIQSTDNDGNVTVVKEIEPKMARQVIDEDTSKKLREYLELVVSIGGGKKAYVEGYHIGGKTGTAQKAEGGSYARGKYVASFLGMAPVENPEIVLFLCIDEPDPSNYYAGQIAAPVAGRIFRDVFAYLNMPSDDGGKPVIEVILPNVVNLSPRQATNKLKEIGMVVETKGSGSVVTSMNPRPGLSIKEGSKVILYTGSGQNYNSRVIVPNLESMGEDEVADVLNSLGLKLGRSGEGYAVSQNPEVGEEVASGSKVNVEFDIYGD